MVNKNFHYRWDFIGLSTDTKPTPTTSEKVVNGSTFYCSDNSKLYVWYKDQWYERTASGGGGGGSDITVVQTSGTSTTDVMSQNATTSMVFADPGTNHNVRIGNTNTNGLNSVSIGYNGTATGKSSVQISSATAGGTSSIAIGASAVAHSNHSVSIGDNTQVPSGSANQYSIALGADAKTSRQGELNIGTGTTTHGYNSTSYRVLGGVHDGQDAHDAVTVEQVNATIDAINTALSANIPHIGANS